ncbi:MAG: hypothetical protein A3J48_03290 [Candidatus Doudnabacteria bacterium RIFCSPHIGHO2_02_FULL_46_11]|uniref:tetrahydrofolate synthase n=1 Tax=Candidatus Doudnabacteria bacterium RIFCSPHIGHO2_02_FULL_46_11 TaxID=1817832 RepID=A0A1F5P7X8_9BACT|nr:MAG: hypothetical protein A3J48_03290 [Candidatus Doudnabacteria bacterium RIFCSPHIGHO2_02_FULL_46_11]
MLSEYKKAREYLEGLIAASKESKVRDFPDLRAKRMSRLMNLLGINQADFKIIHITGTAGKGSTANMIHSCLVVAENRAGLYTSPHLTTLIERIKVGDQYISPRDFSKLVNRVKRVAAGVKKTSLGPFSYFEVLLAVAFLYFRQTKCEYVVLEAGVGGRRDSTNFVRRPLVSVITNIGLDHTYVLGKNLKQIASDKAGVIKKGSKFFTAEKKQSLLAVFKKRCQKVGADFVFVKGDNEELAAAVAGELAVSKSKIKTALKRARLPGRFELVQKKPLIILDVAHNTLKMQRTLKNLKKIKYKRLHLILSVPFSGPLIAAEKLIIAKADFIYFSHETLKWQAVSYRRTIQKSLGKQLAQKNFLIFTDPEAALNKALKQAQVQDLILITSSFYLAGMLGRRWRSENFILTKRRPF